MEQREGRSPWLLSGLFVCVCFCGIFFFVLDLCVYVSLCNCSEVSTRRIQSSLMSDSTKTGLCSTASADSIVHRKGRMQKNAQINKN